MRLSMLGGLRIQAGGRQFIESGSPREEARWDSALRELVDGGLLKDRGHKNEVFAVTHQGFAALESRA